MSDQQSELHLRHLKSAEHNQGLGFQEIVLYLFLRLGGGLPHKKGGDACREISNEPLKGTNLGVA